MKKKYYFVIFTALILALWVFNVFQQLNLITHWEFLNRMQTAVDYVFKLLMVAIVMIFSFQYLQHSRLFKELFHAKQLEKDYEEFKQDTKALAETYKERFKSYETNLCKTDKKLCLQIDHHRQALECIEKEWDEKQHLIIMSGRKSMRYLHNLTMHTPLKELDRNFDRLKTEMENQQDIW